MSKTKDYTHKVFKKVIILYFTTMRPLTHSLYEKSSTKTINKNTVELGSNGVRRGNDER